MKFFLGPGLCSQVLFRWGLWNEEERMNLNHRFDVYWSLDCSYIDVELLIMEFLGLSRMWVAFVTSGLTWLVQVPGDERRYSKRKMEKFPASMWTCCSTAVIFHITWNLVSWISIYIYIIYIILYIYIQSEYLICDLLVNCEFLTFHQQF